MKNYKWINIFYLVLLIILTNKSSAQMFDSIASSLQKKPKFYANYDTRNSFITNKFAQVKGIKAGLTFNRQFTIALGYNWLNSKFKETLKNNIKAALKMRYITPYAEYSFLEHNNIEVTIPVHIGIGWSFYQDSLKKKYNKGVILVYEPSMTLTYRFLKYFGIGGGVGFRVLLIGNRKMNENFNSPIYLLKAKIFFSDLYRDLFQKTK